MYRLDGQCKPFKMQKQYVLETEKNFIKSPNIDQLFYVLGFTLLFI